MQLTTYCHTYSLDKGQNLIQKGQGRSPDIQRMIACQTSNRAISDGLYQSLGLTPAEKANLNQSLLGKGIFQPHGNQLKVSTNQDLGWDYRNMLQTTTTDLVDNEGSTTGRLKEYNTYAKAGQRNRKVTEKTGDTGGTTEINESMYLGNLEYRTTWHGENLSYDGETVTEQSTGVIVSPYEQYTTLRIRQGHKQAAQKKIYAYKDGIKVTEKATIYNLDNNIDSCELTLNGSGQLESYESYKPYGDTAISYGKTTQQPYKYSGQEKDQSGLYAYGFRSYLPANFRWMSPDPAGMQGSGLNWYAMVNGNPITNRDQMGLMRFTRFMIRNEMIMIDFLNGLSHAFEDRQAIQQFSSDDQGEIRSFRNKHWNRHVQYLYGQSMPDSKGRIQSEYQGNRFGMYNGILKDKFFYRSDYSLSLSPNPMSRRYGLLTNAEKRKTYSKTISTIVGAHNLLAERDENLDPVDSEMADKKLFEGFVGTINNVDRSDLFGSVSLGYFKPNNLHRGLTGVYHTSGLFILTPRGVENQDDMIVDLFEGRLGGTHLRLSQKFQNTLGLMYPKEKYTVRDMVGLTLYQEGKGDLFVDFISVSLNSLYMIRHGITDPVAIKGKQLPKTMQQQIAQELSNHFGKTVTVIPPQFRETVVWPGRHKFKPEKNKA